VHFADRLNEAVKRVKNPICVGIDPRPEDLPPGLLDQFSGDRRGVAEAFRVFGFGVIDVVASVTPIVKFQAAFYEAYGPEGMGALHASAKYAQEKGVLVLIDGKRNDIGSTAEAYARAYLGKVPMGESFEPPWNADGLTINAYLGSDGINPFLKIAKKEEKGLYALVRTSNASAIEFQDLVCDGKALYRHVADRLAGWAEPYRGDTRYSLLGAVVGATYPEQLAELRESLPGVPFLVPGYGAQGGSAQDVAPGFDEQGLGAIINSSRGLTFAYTKAAAKARFGDNWQGAIEQAVKDMADDLAANTRAGKLRDSDPAK